MAVLAGCSAEPEAGSCTIDQDCGSGLCDLATGHCVAAAQRQVGLELVPPSGNKQGWVVQEFPSAEPGPDAVVALRLEKAVSVQGQVFASHAPAEPIPAQITAWRESLLPGRPDVQVTASTVETDGHRFVLWLGGGQEHTFYIKPLPPYDRRYPPRVVTLPVDDHLKHDFILDGDDRAIEVEGRVVDRMGEPLSFSVQVRAFRPDSQIRSTIGHTCSEDQPEHCPDGEPRSSEVGYYRLRIPPGVQPYTIRIEPIPLPAKELRSLNPIPMIPTTECTGKVLGLVEPNKGRQLQRMATFRLPAFVHAKMYTVAVVGAGSTVAGSPESGGDASNGPDNAAQTPIAGAQLKFSTELSLKPEEGFDSCSASYAYTGITDADGKLQLPLLPGVSDENRTYRVTTLSPASSAYASQFFATEIGSAGGVLQTIVLESRYALSGAIVGPDERGVAGALIEARGIETTHPDATSHGLPPGKATATADERGRFVLHVDPGVYNLHIQPPADTGLPQFGIDKRAVDGPLDGLLLHAPKPQVLAGRVLDEAGKPVGGFTVNSYETVSDSLSTEQAVLRARGPTDADGRFRLVLPPAGTQAP